MMTEAQIRARVEALLALDPLKPQVSARTLTEIAREWAAHHALPDSDVAAERAACARLLGGLAERLADLSQMLGPIKAEGIAAARDALLIERRRLNAAIDGLRQGLHR